MNKDGNTSCNMQIQLANLTAAATVRYCKQASVTRLLSGPDGLLSKGGISWQGQTYDGAGFDGRIQGQKQVELVQALRINNTTCAYEISVQAASAALLVTV